MLKPPPWHVRAQLWVRSVVMLAGAMWTHVWCELAVAADRFSKYFKNEITAADLLSDYALAEWALERLIAYVSKRKLHVMFYHCQSCSSLHYAIMREATDAEMKKMEGTIETFGRRALLSPRSPFQEGAAMKLVAATLYHFRAAGWDEAMIERRLTKVLPTGS